MSHKLNARIDLNFAVKSKVVTNHEWMSIQMGALIDQDLNRGEHGCHFSSMSSLANVTKDLTQSGPFAMRPARQCLATVQKSKI